MPGLPLVIDTDTASDDAVALVLAAVGESAGDVRAVTTVAGNVPLPHATRNALITLDMAGRRDVPVYEGCDRPILRPLHTAQNVHGQDGMGDIGLPDPSRVATPGHAIDVLTSLPRQHPGELTLVTLGPLTNLAAALVRDRALLSVFRHVYCMAGAADLNGNFSAGAEFNVWVDPEAAAIVLAAATPEKVTWVGIDIARQAAVMTPADQEVLTGIGTPLADFAHRINGTLAAWSLGNALAGYDLPDPVTMAVALNPELIIEHERANVTIAVGDEARGHMLIDRRRSAPPPNLTIVRQADEPGFKDMLFRACATTPTALASDPAGL